MELWSRRKFFLTSLAGSAVASAGKLFGGTRSNGSDPAALSNLAPAAQGKRPLIISSANGLHALDKGMDILKKGGDTLDAVVAAVTIVEDDPNDDSDRRDDGVQRVTALLKDVHPFIEGMKTIGAGNDQRPLALRRTARKCGRSCRCAIRSGARAAKEFTRTGNRAA